MLITLSAWLPHLAECRFAGTFRHPHDVAASLAKRNQMSPEEGVLLWTAYNERLRSLHQERAFPLLRFGGGRDDYLERFARLCNALGLEYDRRGAEAFFEDSLVHASGTEGPLLPRRTREIFDYLLEHQVGAGPEGADLRPGTLPRRDDGAPQRDEERAARSSRSGEERTTAAPLTKAPPV